MIQEVVTSTNMVYYMMIIVGAIGVTAKVTNHFTLRRLLTAASGMSKSTHKLIKLVRAKYEHACMLHDRVENTRAFVEKYIYEYRSFLFRIHTWRQLELQSVWFAGILAVLGAFFWYQANGICEEVYQYLMVGAAEMIALYVISQLSDEPYKVEAVKNYMVDYLENTGMPRYRKGRQAEREQIDVIRTAGGEASAQVARTDTARAEISRADATRGEISRADAARGEISRADAARGEIGRADAARGEIGRTDAARGEVGRTDAAPELSINIEGEPRKNGKIGATQTAFRKTAKEKGVQGEAVQEGNRPFRQDEGGESVAGRVLNVPRAYQAEANRTGQGVRAAYRKENEELYRVEHPTYKEEQPSVREEQLRQILEEFLA